MIKYRQKCGCRLANLPSRMNGLCGLCEEENNLRKLRKQWTVSLSVKQIQLIIFCLYLRRDHIRKDGVFTVRDANGNKTVPTLTEDQTKLWGELGQLAHFLSVVLEGKEVEGRRVPKEEGLGDSIEDLVLDRDLNQDLSRLHSVTLRSLVSLAKSIQSTLEGIKTQLVKMEKLARREA